MEHILVVCGAGASSTFLAHRMRKVAAARGMSITVKAASQSVLDDRLAGVDVLLVGPHLASDFASLADLASAHGVRAGLLAESVFEPAGDVDALDLAIALYEGAASSPSQPKERP